MEKIFLSRSLFGAFLLTVGVTSLFGAYAPRSYRRVQPSTALLSRAQAPVVRAPVAQSSYTYNTRNMRGVQARQHAHNGLFTTGQKKQEPFSSGFLDSVRSWIRSWWELPMQEKMAQGVLFLTAGKMFKDMGMSAYAEYKKVAERQRQERLANERVQEQMVSGECVICREGYSADNPGILTCSRNKHLAHRDCSQGWFQQQRDNGRATPQCPTCRDSMIQV